MLDYDLVQIVASLWAAAILGSWYNFLTVIYVGKILAYYYLSKMNSDKFYPFYEHSISTVSILFLYNKFSLARY